MSSCHSVALLGPGRRTGAVEQHVAHRGQMCDHLALRMGEARAHEIPLTTEHYRPRRCFAEQEPTEGAPAMLRCGASWATGTRSRWMAEGRRGRPWEAGAGEARRSPARLPGVALVLAQGR